MAAVLQMIVVMVSVVLGVVVAIATINILALITGELSRRGSWWTGPAFFCLHFWPAVFLFVLILVSVGAGIALGFFLGLA